MITRRQRRQLVDQLNLSSVGLAALMGSALSLGLIQLLASPLEQVASVNVQNLAMQITLLLIPLLVSLLLVLRDGGVLVIQGGLLAKRHPRWLLRLWQLQAIPQALTGLVLGLYMLAAALVAATLTAPERNNLQELMQLLGSFEPMTFALVLLKTALFAVMTLAICLQQGARCKRQGLAAMTALTRAISLTVAVMLSLDLALVLMFDPLVAPS